MRNIIYTLVAVFLLSCNQSEIKEKELALKEKELALKERELALREKDTVNLKGASLPTIADGRQSQDEINNWLKDACGISYTFSSKELDKAKFSTLNYYLTPPSGELKKLLQEPLLVELIKKGVTAKTIKISPHSITFEYSYDEPGTGRVLFLLENKMYYTQWYVTAAETYEYDLVTLKLKKLPYSINSIKNGTATIENSYYDPRGPDDPNYEGHIFIEGKLDILTNKVTWGKRL